MGLCCHWPVLSPVQKVVFLGGMEVHKDPVSSIRHGNSSWCYKIYFISPDTDLCNTDFCRSERPGQQKSDAQDHTTRALHLLWNYMSGAKEASNSA